MDIGGCYNFRENLSPPGGAFCQAGTEEGIEFLLKAEAHLNKSAAAKLAFRFVIAIGIVNLFADMTYEGARAITGPFLGSLGASAAVVGFVAGFGELVGYALRSVTGYMARFSEQDGDRARWQTDPVRGS